MEHLVTKKPPSGEGAAEAGRKPTVAQKALITRNLRLAYGEVASEPVPKHLLELLNRIDEGEKS